MIELSYMLGALAVLALAEFLWEHRQALLKERP
jgi:hypothetical protein